jgi:hypothetical protein
MPDHAELLIVERLLPEDDSPSLAVAWDLHMMCNVGGRERTVTEYHLLPRRMRCSAGSARDWDRTERISPTCC